MAFARGAFALLACLALASYGAQAQSECTTAKDFLTNNLGQLSIFTQVLNATGLLDSLADPNATLTLLAPNNAAWLSLIAGSNYSSIDQLLAEPTLDVIAENHVLPYIWQASNFVSGQPLATMADENLTATLDQVGQAYNATTILLASFAGEGSILNADIPTCNAHVQIINGVLLPLQALDLSELLAQLLFLVDTQGPDMFAQEVINAIRSGSVDADAVARLLAAAWQSGFAEQMTLGTRRILASSGGANLLAQNLLTTLSLDMFNEMTSSATWALETGYPEFFANVAAAAINITGCDHVLQTYLSGVKNLTALAQVSGAFNSAVATQPTVQTCLGA